MAVVLSREASASNQPREELPTHPVIATGSPGHRQPTTTTMAKRAQSFSPSCESDGTPTCASLLHGPRGGKHRSVHGVGRQRWEPQRMESISRYAGHCVGLRRVRERAHYGQTEHQKSSKDAFRGAAQVCEQLCGHVGSKCSTNQKA